MAMVASILVISCLAVFVPTADAYAARYFGLTFRAPVFVPQDLCVNWYSGFLPNLYTPARDYQMRLVATDLRIGRSHIYPLSGTIGTSLCTLPNNCVWQWRGGPFQDSPVTFFVGLQYSPGLPSLTNDYHRWVFGGLRDPLTFPRAGFLTNLQGWRATELTFPSLTFACEVVDSSQAASITPPVTPETANLTENAVRAITDDEDASYTDAAASGPSSKWLIGMMAAISVAFVAAL